MDKALNDLLGDILSEENKELISEAWDKKLAEAKASVRAEIEDELREEFAQRYDHDKGILVEAMDRMLADVINKELTEFNEDRKDLNRQRRQVMKEKANLRRLNKQRLKEHLKTLDTFVLRQLNEEIGEFSDDRKAISSQRLKLSKAIIEARNQYKRKLTEHKKVLEGFLMRQLKEEIQEFVQDRKLLSEQRMQVGKQLREGRLEYKRKLNERVKTLEKFVLGQLTQEMREFNSDKKALVESRVKLVREGRQKLSESRKNFITKASKIVESTIEDALRKEMTQFRDDIKQARENNFGRRLFEAFCAEYMTSHYSEASEVGRLQKQLSEQQKRLEEATASLSKQNQVLTETKHRLTKAEDSAKRAEIMSSLMSGLRRDRQAMMEELLSGVRTNQLREAFRKYLPSVLNDDERTVAQHGRKRLSETNNVEKRTVATGNRPNRLAESVHLEEQNVNEDGELGQILHLAGIQGKEKIQ